MLISYRKSAFTIRKSPLSTNWYLRTANYFKVTTETQEFIPDSELSMEYTVDLLSDKIDMRENCIKRCIETPGCFTIEQDDSSSPKCKLGGNSIQNADPKFYYGKYILVPKLGRFSLFFSNFSGFGHMLTTFIIPDRERLFFDSR